MTIIVTGGAGFIGSNFIFYMLKEHPQDRIVCLDSLTYAGNLSTLAPVMDQPNFRFVKLDICDRPGVYTLFEEEKPDVIVLDPPRDGIHPKALPKILDYGVDKIVYISCKPTSLARDLTLLYGEGYRLVQGKVVDMFPGTGHVETVCLLTREKSVKSYAYVDITPSELGMGGKVKKPTYKQIQAYVLETHGLKVSPLYIANVKDEFGLEKQFSYEEAGMSAKKRPNCPSEKRAAIIDALIHFGMLDEDSRETE